jgi:hypothetical protein
MFKKFMEEQQKIITPESDMTQVMERLHDLYFNNPIFHHLFQKGKFFPIDNKT